MPTQAPSAAPPDPSPAGPANAFSALFLRRTEALDEPPTATEAEFAGPWRAEAHGDQAALWREWEDPDQGDHPFAVLADDQTAQLAAALLPARGRLGSYRIDPHRELEGFPLERYGQRIGHLAYFDEHFAEGLSVLEALVRNPPALALLLSAAGPTALEHIGRILHRKLVADTDD